MSMSVNCPVCQTEVKPTPLASYTSTQAAAHFCPEIRNSDRYNRLKNCIERLWQGQESVILQCPSCEFAFGYPFVGGDEEFYTILHEQQDYPSWRWDYGVAMREVFEPLGGGKVLEIGAGSGALLKVLSDRWQKFAVEGSELTRQPLEELGIEVFRDLNVATSSHSKSFDVIVMAQVLEHISDFHPLLSQCHQLLKYGGQLFIGVPLGEAMIRQERLTGWADMPPNHINKWTPKSLSITLAKAGFHASKPIFQPASLKNIKASIHLKIIVDATRPSSLAAQIYRIPQRRLRALLLAGLALPALINVLPHAQELTLGGAFTMRGRAQ